MIYILERFLFITQLIMSTDYVLYLPAVHLQARLQRTSATSSTRRIRPLQYNAQVYDVNKAPTTEEVNAIARDVCLSVCLSVSKITQKRVHGFG